MHLLGYSSFVLIASAAPTPLSKHPQVADHLPLNHPSQPPPHSPLVPERRPSANYTNINCPVIFDGRVPKNLTLTSFDSASSSPYSPSYVKGENITWSSVLLFPSTSLSRFDQSTHHKLVEVTVDDRSLFRAGENLQVGFRRAGLLLKDDVNDPGADASDTGIVTFHWSVKQDAGRPLNLSHEYMNVWHEKANYSGNQFTFVGGVVLPGDGGVDKESNRWRVQNAKNEFMFEVSIEREEWQNFGVQLDYSNDTIKVFYSKGLAPLEAVTPAMPNDNAGGGQLQIGIAKKPTETKTVVFDGFQELIPLRGEGQIYGGIFVEKSDQGCISL